MMFEKFDALRYHKKGQTRKRLRKNYKTLVSKQYYKIRAMELSAMQESIMRRIVGSVIQSILYVHANQDDHVQLCLGNLLIHLVQGPGRVTIR